MSQVAVSSSFGYFRFENIPVGQTYTISVRAKGRTFAPKIVMVNDYMTDVDLVGSP